MNIYIHIPFCDLKCKYCRFASIGNKQNLHIKKYVSFLCEEIKNIREKIIINTIYFGGGTPGILDNNDLEKIITVLKDNFVFSKNIEITIESTPNNIKYEKLLSWYKLGINRLSIGIQTLNKKSLLEINRGNKLDISQCFLELNNFYKKTNLKFNLNFDFIIGLPYVTKGEILSNIKYSLEKCNVINHISVYMLEDYYNIDRIIENKYDNITYPKIWKELGLSDDEFEFEYNEISNFLENKGYKKYEISNFAQKGFECIHNKGYWNHKETLGFGMGAHSLIKIENKLYRKRNSDNFSNYYSYKDIIYEKLDKEDIMYEKLLFGIRTLGIGKNDYTKLNKERIKYFLDNKYLQKNNDYIYLTNKGVVIMDFILKELIN